VSLFIHQTDITVPDSSHSTCKEVVPGSKFGKWVGMSSVTCSWQKSSRMAWLRFDSPEKLNAAALTLMTHPTSSGRVLYCKAQPIQGRNSHNVLEVRNLEADDQEDFFGFLKEEERPMHVKLREPFHNVSNVKAGRIVKKLLASKGHLEHFHVYNDPKNIKLRATAVFLRAEDASKAIEELNGLTLVDLGRFNAESYVHVKFNIPNKPGCGIEWDEQAVKRFQQEV